MLIGNGPLREQLRRPGPGRGLDRGPRPMWRLGELRPKVRPEPLKLPPAQGEEPRESGHACSASPAGCAWPGQLSGVLLSRVCVLLVVAVGGEGPWSGG